MGGRGCTAEGSGWVRALTWFCLRCGDVAALAGGRRGADAGTAWGLTLALILVTVSAFVFVFASFAPFLAAGHVCACYGIQGQIAEHHAIAAYLDLLQIRKYTMRSANVRVDIKGCV